MSLWALEYFSVRDRIAVVTGASSGIGRHMALALAQAGAHVVAIARRTSALDSLADDLKARYTFAHRSQVDAASSVGSISPLTCDLMAVSNFDDLAQRVRTPFGNPSILVNAAGVNYREPVDSISPDSWQQTLQLNLSVPFFLSRALVGSMTAGASIINIASLQSSRAFPNSMPYGASKGGIAQLTRAMAEAWSAQGVRCNAIAPGFFPTELTRAVFDDEHRAAANAAQTCMGRNGELDDLTGPLLFLSSAASGYVTGQVLYVDGGFSAR